MKSQHSKCVGIEICNIFSFSQYVLPFWLKESGSFSQKEAVWYKVCNPTILNMLESRFATILVFPKVFQLTESGFIAQEVAVLYKGWNQYYQLYTSQGNPKNPDNRQTNIQTHKPIIILFWPMGLNNLSWDGIQSWIVIVYGYCCVTSLFTISTGMNLTTAKACYSVKMSLISNI